MGHVRHIAALALCSGVWAAGLGAQEAAPGQSDAPLSAIDWLSESVITLPTAAPFPGSAPGRPTIGEAPVADTATVPDVVVTPLDLPSPDRIGILPPSSTGLPRNLWSGSTQTDLVMLVRAERVDGLPAIQSFIVSLMLAEAEPPAGAGPDGQLFLARVDKLLDIGALEPALELLRAADPKTPDLFRRYFDAALLTGAEASTCQRLLAKPEIAPTLSARVFCLARSGDWVAAALTLGTASALGDLDPETAVLLARFLDPELFEGEPPLAAPTRVTPLVFRMREAVGEGLATPPLPLAFAHADLRDTVGWKARLEAAERLARAGAIGHVPLFDLYSLQRPAASGGVWDRAKAFQDLDAALDTGDDLAKAMSAAWDAAKDARIEVAFAEHYIRALMTSDHLSFPSTGSDAAEFQQVYLQIGLLSSEYETVALDLGEIGPLTANPDAILRSIAQGVADNGIGRPRLPYDLATIQSAFAPDTTPPATLLAMAEDGRLGEALLRAIALFNEGVQGDAKAAAEALALFRAVGLEDLARRAALQYLILDRAP